MPCTRGGGCHRRRLHMVCSHLGSSVRGAQAAARSTIATVVAAAPPSSQEGEPPTIEPMTDYERFMFDLKGFVVIPSVLGPEELAAVRGHIDAYSDRPQSLPDSLRSPVSGPAEFLIDHPRVLGILTALVSPDTARLRLESMFTSRRSVADGTGTGRPLWRPHGGGPGLRGPSFDYRTQVIQRTPGSTTLRGGCVCNREMLGVQNSRIYGGMTRVVWELNDVVKGQGGTCLVPGSHKAELPFDWNNHLATQDRLSGVPWPVEADSADSGCAAPQVDRVCRYRGKPFMYHSQKGSASSHPCMAHRVRPFDGAPRGSGRSDRGWWRREQHSVWETYGCPAGSILVFSEAV
jgi:hypothetical protein